MRLQQNINQERSTSHFGSKTQGKSTIMRFEIKSPFEKCTYFTRKRSFRVFFCFGAISGEDKLYIINPNTSGKTNTEFFFCYSDIICLTKCFDNRIIK